MRKSNISVTALCCSFCSFFFVIFPLAGVFMIWGRTGDFTREPIFGTGPFVAGGLRMVQGANFSGFLTQRLTWEEVRFGKPSPCTNSAENNNMFTNWSQRYGFCSTEGGEFVVPVIVRVIQAFLVLNVVLLAVLVCLGCWHHSASDGETTPPSSDSFSSSTSPDPDPAADAILKQCKRNAGYSAVVTLLAMGSTIVTFALIASTQWYQDLRDKGVKPVFMPLVNDQGDLMAVDVTQVDFVYGPTFVVLILCFISTLVTLGLYTAMWHWPEMQRIRGYYGHQDDREEDGYSEPASEETSTAKQTTKGPDLEAAAETKGNAEGAEGDAGKDEEDTNKAEQKEEPSSDERSLEETQKTESGTPGGDGDVEKESEKESENATKAVHFA